jgi:hypothetical protein
MDLMGLVGPVGENPSSKSVSTGGRIRASAVDESESSGGGKRPAVEEGMRSCTPEDDQDVEIDLTGENGRACPCRPGLVPGPNTSWRKRSKSHCDARLMRVFVDIVAVHGGVGGTSGMLTPAARPPKKRRKKPKQTRKYLKYSPTHVIRK